MFWNVLLLTDLNQSLLHSLVELTANLIADLCSTKAKAVLQQIQRVSEQEPRRKSRCVALRPLPTLKQRAVISGPQRLRIERAARTGRTAILTKPEKPDFRRWTTTQSGQRGSREVSRPVTTNG